MVFFFAMDIEKSPVNIALPVHTTPAWFVGPATGEVFEGQADCYPRLQGWGLFEGFGVVEGKVWKDETSRYEFRCKLHSIMTLNTHALRVRNAGRMGRARR